MCRRVWAVLGKVDINASRTKAYWALPGCCPLSHLVANYVSVDENKHVKLIDHLNTNHVASRTKCTYVLNFARIAAKLGMGNPFGRMGSSRL